MSKETALTFVTYEMGYIEEGLDGKKKQYMTNKQGKDTHPGQLFLFSKFEPTTLHVLGEHSTNWQLSWLSSNPSIQGKATNLMNR